MPDTLPTYTPGPWSYNDGMAEVTDSRGKTIADVAPGDRYDDDTATVDADGRLIALAPELAAMVQTLADQIEGYDRGEGDQFITPRPFHELVAEAHALLARLEGDR